MSIVKELDMNSLQKQIIFLALPMILSGTANAETVSSTITGEVVDFYDNSRVCALLIINGNYQTYSCTTDGTNAGAPFTLHYNYLTNSSDTSANKLLIFADGYKNETLQITQPDESVFIHMKKTDNSFVGEWIIGVVNGNGFSLRNDPNTSCGYANCNLFMIGKDNGLTVEGGWSIPAPHGYGDVYSLTAIYKDSDTLQWTIDKSSALRVGLPPDCTDTGTMRRIGYSFIIVSNETRQCWSTASTEYWIRYSH